MRPTVTLLSALAMCFAVAVPASAGTATAAEASAWTRCEALGTTMWHDPAGGGWVIPTTVLRSGSANACVTFAQQHLNQWLPGDIDVDGVYGPETIAAVKKFQRLFHGVAGPVDGIVGRQTWSQLVFSPN